jgi:hypothetical protein
VRNLPDPSRRTLFSITNPGHPHTAILDQDSAYGLHQFDLLCGANERLVAAIDGSEGAVGGSQLLLDAHTLGDFSQQPFFRGLVQLQGDVSLRRKPVVGRASRSDLSA